MLPFETIESGLKTPFIASIPHSGMFIPYEAAACFTPEHYASLVNTDWYLDRVYDFLPSIGITVIKNNIYKYVIDVNRDTTNPLYGDYWKCVVPSEIPQGVPCWWQLYQREPTNEEILERIRLYHKPYHDELDRLIQNVKAKFGVTYLFDLHSYIGGVEADVCLGNRQGKTCRESFLESVYQKIKMCGINVVKNSVFTGGFITRKYHVEDVVHTLQVEIRSEIFIDKSELDQGRPPKLEQKRLFPIQKALKKVFAEIVSENHVQ